MKRAASIAVDDYAAQRAIDKNGRVSDRRADQGLTHEPKKWEPVLG
jgi:hypothetical protein